MKTQVNILKMSLFPKILSLKSCLHIRCDTASPCIQLYVFWTFLDIVMYPPVKLYLNQCFQVSQLIKYDGNIVIT